MNDNSTRGLQWQKLVGDFFIPRFGGSVDQWAEANRLTVQSLIERMDRIYDEPTVQIVQDYYRKEHLFWITSMFGHMGLPLPFAGDENQMVGLSEEAGRWISPRVKSSYPGMIDTIHQLSEIYELFTASNEVSYELQGYLSGMGVDHLFSEFYGPDLLGAFKSSPYYYYEIIRQTDIDPSQAVVIDDKLKNLQFARQAGFHTIHSGLDGAIPSKDQVQFPYYRNVSDLELLLLQLDQE